MQHFVRGREKAVLTSPLLKNAARTFDFDFRSMAEQVIIKIPARKHLAKFFISQYKRRLSMQDPMGITIYYMLRDKSAARYSDKLLHDFPAHLELEVGQFQLERKYLNPYLTPDSVKHIDIILDDLFKRTLYRHIDMKLETGLNRKMAIEDFCEKYDVLESDISFDALKKADFRYRISQKAA